MHWEYASAFVKAAVAPGEDPPVWAAVVVGPAPTLVTLGDVDPPEQAASATPSRPRTAAGHSFDERIT
jgi:hypothetical protein